MRDEERQDVIEVIEKLLYKTLEISSMMKRGEFIVAHEKLGGVIKNLSAIGGKLQQTEKINTQSD